MKNLLSILLIISIISIINSLFIFDQDYIDDSKVFKTKFVETLDDFYLSNEQSFIVYLIYDSTGPSEKNEKYFNDFQQMTKVYREISDKTDLTSFYLIDIANDPNLLIEMEINTIPCYNVKMPNSKSVFLQVLRHPDLGRALAENILERYNKYFSIDLDTELSSLSRRFISPFEIENFIKANEVTVVYIGDNKHDFNYYTEIAKTYSSRNIIYKAEYSKIHFCHCLQKECFEYFNAYNAEKGDILVFENLSDQSNNKRNQKYLKIFNQETNIIELYKEFYYTSRLNYIEFNEFAVYMIFKMHNPAIVIFFEEKKDSQYKFINELATELKVSSIIVISMLLSLLLLRLLLCLIGCYYYYFFL